MQTKQQEEKEGKLQKKVKTENYESALDKAMQSIDSHQEKSNFQQYYEEESEQLSKAIEQQRKIQLEKKQNGIEKKNAKLENPDARRLSSQDFNKIIESEKQSLNGKQLLSTIITTTDFLKNIQTQIEQQEIKQKIMQPTKYGISDTKEGTTSVVNISLPSEKLINFCRNSETVSTFGYQSAFNRQLYSKSQTSKPQQQSLIKEPQPQQQQEEEEEIKENPVDQANDNENYEEILEKCKEELQCLKEEDIGSGMAKALDRLRQRGDLIDEGREYAGRARDKTWFQEEGKYGPKPQGMGGEKLNLEYRDDTGRIMTPKEAFRYLCWIFHGKKPGKNKIDKKMKKQQMEQKAKFSDPSNAPLLKALQKHTNKTNQPFMVLGQLEQQQQQF